jgi:Mor family transcriptional regulator
MSQLHFKEEKNQMKESLFITYRGRTQSLQEWAKEYQISYNALYGRYKKGWDFKKALNAPVQKRDMRTPIPHLAKKYKISERLIRARVSRGWTLESASTTPKKRTYRFFGVKKKAKEMGISISTVRNRLERGVPFEQAFEKKGKSQ